MTKTNPRLTEHQLEMDLEDLVEEYSSLGNEYIALVISDFAANLDQREKDL